MMERAERSHIPAIGSVAIGEIVNIITSIYGSSPPCSATGATPQQDQPCDCDKGLNSMGSTKECVRSPTDESQRRSGSASSAQRTTASLSQQMRGSGLSAVRTLRSALGARPADQAPSSRFLEANRGRAFADVYDLHERIGSGASSTVHRATRRLDGVCVAVKVVRPGGDEALSDARDEVVIHSNLDHEHIVRLLDAFDDQGTLYLVMELCEGGEIFEALVSGDSYDEADAVAVLRKMLEALAYLASKGVAHRDVKLENVLLKSRGGRTDVVLADLGIARRFPTRDRSFAGSPYYVSPEVVLGGAFCAKTDVWSLGVTAYALLTGTMPFHAESALSLNRRICEQPVDFDRPQWASVSAAGRAFVARMLTRDVGRRPGAAALLGDPWITQSRTSPLDANLPHMRQLISNRRRWRQSIHAVRAVNILASPQASSRFARLAPIASASLIDTGDDAEPPQSSSGDAEPEPFIDAGDADADPRQSSSSDADPEPQQSRIGDAEPEPQRSSGDAALLRGSDDADEPRPR